MRARTEKMLNRLLDEAFLGYTQKRYIADDEIADFKAEFLQVVKNNCLRDQLEVAKIEGEGDEVHLSFSLKDNE